MIPPDGVERKLDGVVDSVPPDKGCEVLDGEFADSDASHILLKWGVVVIIKCYEG